MKKINNSIIYFLKIKVAFFFYVNKSMIPICRLAIDR